MERLYHFLKHKSIPDLSDIAFNIGTEPNPTFVQRRDCFSEVEISVKHVAKNLWRTPHILCSNVLMDASKTLSTVIFKPSIL